MEEWGRFYRVLGFFVLSNQKMSIEVHCISIVLMALFASGCTFKPVAVPKQPANYKNLKTTLSQNPSSTGQDLVTTQDLNSGQVQAQNNREEEQPDPRAKPNISFFKSAIEQPLSPENTEELLSEVGSNWLYGQGLGESALTIGTIAVFPPYALWVVGNAALQLSGEEPLEVSSMLPGESGEIWRSTYDGITSLPGHTSAVVAGEEFRSKDVARERIEAVLEKNSQEHKKKLIIDEQLRQK